MNNYIEKNLNEYDLFFDKELNDAQLEGYLRKISPLIGKIVIAFNYLEDSINFIIKELVSDSFYKDEIPWIFISEMPFSNKVNVLEKLYRFYLRFSEKDYEDELKFLIAGLREAGNKRNFIVHANWNEVNSDSLVKIRTKVKNYGAKNIYKIIDTESLEKEEKFIYNIHECLEKFDEDYMKH